MKLRSERISYRYAETGRLVLDDVSFELAAGEITAILGPNGSGKSTLLKLLAGLMAPGLDAKIEIEGRPLAGLSAAERARQIAYVPADLRAEFPLTAFEAVSLGRTPQRFRVPGGVTLAEHDRIQSAMERAGCWDLRERELSSLSGGERQLVAVARSLAQGAAVLLFDETLSRMDLHHQQRMRSLFRELASRGFAIALVSHDINLASEISTRAFALEKGARIAAGALSDVLTEPLLARMYPGSSLSVRPSPVSGQPKVYFQK